jgi:hypothetical protein
MWITTSIKIGLIHDLISTKSNLTKWAPREDTKQQGIDVRSICLNTCNIAFTLDRCLPNKTRRYG